MNKDAIALLDTAFFALLQKAMKPDGTLAASE